MPLVVDTFKAGTIDATQSITINGESVGLKYKVYTALLTQSGMDAPVATVLENTLGDIIWTRQGEGSYFGTLLGLFSNPLKVGIILSSIQNPITIAGENNENSIFIETSTDGYLYNAFLEIRVYN